MISLVVLLCRLTFAVLYYSLYASYLLCRWTIGLVAVAVTLLVRAISAGAKARSVQQMPRVGPDGDFSGLIAPSHASALEPSRSEPPASARWDPPTGTADDDGALVHLTIQPGGRPQTHARAEAGVSATLDSVIGGEPDAMVPLDLVGDGSIVMWTRSQARQPNEAATRMVAACGGTAPVFGPVVILGLDADGEPISLSDADASALLRMLEQPAPA
jgi:hypothetical protein